MRPTPRLEALLAGLLLAAPAQAHDTWADGRPIPQWVKMQCCGGNDAHDLTDEHIGWWPVQGGYMVEGFDTIVRKAQPSQDGHAWAFYYYRGADAPIYCLFLPLDW
jgi:hypothetical protein